MGGGQHAVSVEQALPAGRVELAVAVQVYVRHEGILAVGHFSTACYHGAYGGRRRLLIGGRPWDGFSALHKHEKGHPNRGDQRSHQGRPQRLPNDLLYRHRAFSPLPSWWGSARTTRDPAPLRKHIRNA